MIVRFRHIDGTIVGPFANVERVSDGPGHTYQIHFWDRRGMHTVPREYIIRVEIANSHADFDAINNAPQHWVGDRVCDLVANAASNERTDHETVGGDG